MYKTFYRQKFELLINFVDTKLDIHITKIKKHKTIKF